MALTEAFVDAHIARWQRTLASPNYSYRRHWPECLFHHAPLENALSILRTGMLRSRNDPDNSHPRDVAAQNVVEAREHAHDRVRLYFRPNTPTQYHIEGIRKPGECHFGDRAHAPVLVMFVLDAKRILTLPDIQFCDRNMQRADAMPDDSEAYFSSIPFDNVFHEGPHQNDMITAHRCAEVLPSSPLPLDHCIRAIYFRSEPERDTLLHLLGNDRQRWPNRFLIPDALKTFQKRHSFVQDIGLTPEGIFFLLNPRHDRHGVDIRITVNDLVGNSVVQFHSANLPAAPPQGRWIYRHAFDAGVFVVRVEIDEHLAYHAPISLADSLF